MLPILTKHHPLDKLARSLRLDILDMIYATGSGHIGGSFSSLDLIIAVYFSGAFNLKKDKFVLSAGHYAPALYAVLAEAGYFPKSKLKTTGELGSFLQGHTSIETPGINFSAGSLGQGLSFAAGMAIAHKKEQIICLTSDGEHNEGQIWEAAMFANKYKLGNLVNIVDHNKYQIDGSTEDIMPLGDLASKYIRFGWTVTVVDGHDFNQIVRALKNSKNSDYPNCIIANTIFARGISYMQYDPAYHDVKNLDPKLYQRAKQELENLY